MAHSGFNRSELLEWLRKVQTTGEIRDFPHATPSPQQRIHPTQKPLPLISEFVGLFSESKGLVFDPFAGSGTTVIAARQQGRVAIGYELDPELFAVAAQRVEAELGKNLLL